MVLSEDVISQYPASGGCDQCIHTSGGGGDQCIHTSGGGGDQLVRIFRGSSVISKYLLLEGTIS